LEYRDRIVIVTGASSGIGFVTARAFAARGAVVVAVARREELLRKLVDLCAPSSPRSIYLAGDLGERAFAERVVDETVQRFGRIDVLINNAAVSKHKHTYHTGADEAEMVLRVNFLSTLWTTYAAIPYMLRDGGGTIVNVSSFAAKVVPPREGLYAASKAAMDAFSEGLWSDLAGSRIHVGLVHPGPIDTEIWDKEDEPPAYDGKKFPPEIVTDAIFAVIERKIHERTVPRWSAQLIAARVLRLLAPSILRRGMAHMDPVPSDVLERARERARRGRRLGDSRPILRLVRRRKRQPSRLASSSLATRERAPRGRVARRTRMANASRSAIEAVLLDVDGTLVDSNEQHARAWADALIEHGFSPRLAEVRRMIGMGGDRILPLVAGIPDDSPVGIAIDERRTEIFRTRYLSTVHALPGAAELVAALRARGLRIAIASSADPETLRDLLAIAGAPELAESAASSGDTDSSKPAPDVVCVALERVGVAAEAALMVGDTPYDVAAARRAGVDFVGLRSGGWSEAALVGSLAVYDDPADMIAHLETPPLAERLRGSVLHEWASAQPAGA
jgi:HAD superfamily hydrolase (TIGR01509 family)